MTTVTVEVELQRQTALMQANKVRTARAAVKRQLREEECKAAALEMAAGLVAVLPEDLEGMRVLDLLGACRGVGKATARTLMTRAHVQSGATFGRLTTRQRFGLIATLRGGRVSAP